MNAAYEVPENNYLQNKRLGYFHDEVALGCVFGSVVVTNV